MNASQCLRSSPSQSVSMMKAPTIDSDAADRDALSFLDSLGNDHSQAASTPSPVGSALATDISDPVATAMTTPGRSKTHVRAQRKPKKKRLPRPDRYWTAKHEMHTLRSEVEHLSHKIALLQQCSTSPSEDLAIQKTVNKRLATWKRLANHERARREQAEHTNAKLQALLQYQRQWAGGMSGEVAQAAGALIKVSAQLAEQQTVRQETATTTHKSKSKLHNATWLEVLRHLYLEAFAFVTGDIVYQIETFDWVAASESALRSRPLLEWTTSFAIPRRDPGSAGGLWWQAIQRIHDSRGSCEYTDGVIPRMERSCKWSLWDETNNREVRSTSVSVLESRQSDEFWIMAWTTTVYDECDVVLFRATASITITKASAGNAEACLSRSHYRIHHPSAALVPRRSLEASRPPDTADLTSSEAKVAMDNWVKMTREKDRERQLEFMA